jgi:serine/threonine-protein kinase
MAEAAPEKIGSFAVIRQIYAGTAAEVWLAKRKGPGGFVRRVAIKRLTKEVAGDDKAVRALLDEGHMQGLVSHPNVVPIHEVALIDGRYHLIMDYVDGPDLAAVLERCLDKGGAVPVVHALLICADVARGLEAVHTARGGCGSPAYIVHRDVCLRNILLGWEGSVRLADFGVATAARRLSETRVASVKGTPGYLSPEQASSADVDARSDVFSLGVCLYHLTTGHLPFQGDSPEALVRAARDTVYAPPSSHATHLPEGFDKLVGAFLERLPRRRYDVAQDAGAAMTRYLQHLDPEFTSANLTGFLAAIFPETGSAEEDSANTDVYRRKKN